MAFLIVFLGAGIGGVLRHLVNLGASRWLPTGFPAGTFTVNVIGSFVMGLVAGYFAARPGMSQHLRLFFATGILGGFTTFSAFSLDAATLFERNEPALAFGYVAGSVIVSIGALFFGLSLFRGPAQS